MRVSSRCTLTHFAIGHPRCAISRPWRRCWARHQGAMLNAANGMICSSHIKCAAHEAPLCPCDVALLDGTAPAGSAVAALAERGVLAECDSTRRMSGRGRHAVEAVPACRACEASLLPADAAGHGAAGAPLAKPLKLVGRPPGKAVSLRAISEQRFRVLDAGQGDKLLEELEPHQVRV